MNENEVSGRIIGCGMKVHTALGPGLLESVYEACLEYELTKAGLKVERQKPIPLIYESLHFECAYCADLIVDRKVIVEVKSIESFHPIHSPKLLTYLRLANLKLGLLINFNVLHLKDGIKRVANGL